MSESKARLCFEVLTLFPEAIRGFVGTGLLGKAIDKGLVQVHCTDIRDFTTDRHRTVDDAPFGGGAGMVMKPGPVVEALETVTVARGPMHRVLLTPSAPRFDQRAAERLASKPRIALICGRYEGIDDRVREHYVDEALSLGDFILGGGEVAALAVIEAVSRLVEGVLGNPDSVVGESFGSGDAGLLEHPQYTRPADFRGHRVPEVLLGGDHQAVKAWRHEAALERTWALRPDLRAAPRLPEDTQIYLALDATIEPSSEWVELVRRHGLGALILLGETEVGAWVQALGGRVQVTSFGGLKMLRKRLRQRGGADPRMVAVCAEPSSDPDDLGAIRDPRVLLDTLTASAAPERRDLVLWVVDAGKLQGHPDRPRLDAVYAPSEATSPTSEEVADSDRSGLETGAEIADPSRPPLRLVEQADRALNHLRPRR